MAAALHPQPDVRGNRWLDQCSDENGQPYNHDQTQSDDLNRPRRVASYLRVVFGGSTDCILWICPSAHDTFAFRVTTPDVDRFNNATPPQSIEAKLKHLSIFAYPIMN